MKKLLFALPVLFVSGVASAADLKLSYVKTDIGGGLFSYDFTLGVDISASAFVPGSGWGWLIFGDAAFPGPSLMSDFTMTSSFPVGPWTSLSSSSGGHNGPTFANVGDTWNPIADTDTLTWSGTSAWDAPDGELLFSTLITEGGATASNFKIAQPVPEPTSMIALGAGALALLRRRKKA